MKDFGKEGADLLEKGLKGRGPTREMVIKGKRGVVPTEQEKEQALYEIGRGQPQPKLAAEMMNFIREQMLGEEKPADIDWGAAQKLADEIKEITDGRKEFDFSDFHDREIELERMRNFLASEEGGAWFDKFVKTPEGQKWARELGEEMKEKYSEKERELVVEGRIRSKYTEVKNQKLIKEINKLAGALTGKDKVELSFVFDENNRVTRVRAFVKDKQVASVPVGALVAAWGGSARKGTVEIGGVAISVDKKEEELGQEIRKTWKMIDGKLTRQDIYVNFVWELTRKGR